MTLPVATHSHVEPPLLSRRLHWAVFFWPVLAMLLFPVWTRWSTSGYSGLAERPWLLSSTAALPGFLWVCWRVLVYEDTYYIITPRRLIFSSFMPGNPLSVRGELALTHVESVTLWRSLLGRLLGFGTVVVLGNSGIPYPLRFIPNPGEFEHTVRAAIEAVRADNPLAAPAAGLPPIAAPGPLKASPQDRSRPSPFADVLRTPLQQAWEDMTKPLPSPPEDDARFRPKAGQPPAP